MTEAADDGRAASVRLYVDGGAFGGDGACRVVPDDGAGALSAACDAGEGRATACACSTAATANGWRRSPTRRQTRLPLRLRDTDSAEQTDGARFLARSSRRSRRRRPIISPQKATELGVRVLQPVFTRRTIVARVNLERMRANAIEAAEQSGRLTVPEIREPLPLRDAVALAGEPPARLLRRGRRRGADRDGTAPGRRRTAWAILTGPEGGFDPEERAASARAALRHARCRWARASCAPIRPRWRRWRSGRP